MDSHDQSLSPTKRALQAIQLLQAKVEALEKARDQPIAVIGLGCRFPGASNPSEFWELLQGGKDAISEIPRDRWDINRYYSPDPGSPGKMTTRYGGFVSDLLDFDAKFFRVSPREAMSLDPQQRLLLEVSWEALENAGLAPDSLADRQVGVFVGISAIDYWHQLLKRDADDIDAYLITGNTHSVASGRISYLLGLTGPSLSVDTACSSSLSAMHLACQSLRHDECSVAIAGGVNGILNPEATINFSKAQMLSADGRCKSFDQAADGFGRAEGCGVVVLRRLSDAVADGDNIRAVILGSALNHTGRTSGLTVPKGPAQQQVIRDAIATTKLTPSQISYIEAHGTGTALGDPIELGALREVFGPHRSEPLLVGSVKTNIGHLEAASGMAGLIKVVLSLQHSAIPANLHFKTPTPHFDWSQPLQVPTQLTPWPSSDSPRTAGVSAFGFNGTNAHLIVSEPPDISISQVPPLPYQLLTLSARSALALQQLINRYINFLKHRPQLSSLGELCWTANTGRSHFPHRLAVIAASVSELQKHLLAVSQGTTPTGVIQGQGNNASTSTVQLSHQQIQVSGLSNKVQKIPLPPPSEQWLLVLKALAEQYVMGASIHWQTSGFQPYRKIELPTYPFQRQHYGL
ncbi:Phthiocerol synthesis polyketide synthase type IPpsD [Acaryochloris thomasi RCC1774]|uniref:Phthiocerol synthesis polyketide synthase type IPpsD n=1 Tax=Acaryochloris thomasi RCC1774 TaxID=1764569 RepID=A0A2W1JHZ7_9CYAN|nr:polyketide synthase [Acaryochloris thomasi]PZD73160.1 Phthiocerol synthesis polyketide synthase type IPpsD [Acaryochloris thomasi RCC1774]